MKVLEFAFDDGADCLYLPHNFVQNSIVYTGTHDNDTLVGWIESMGEHTRNYTKAYLDLEEDDMEKMVWALIRLALGSVAERAVIPMQDYLCLGTEARINVPSTLGNNWKWRLQKGQFTDELADRIRGISAVYGRL